MKSWRLHTSMAIVTKDNVQMAMPIAAGSGDIKPGCAPAGSSVVTLFRLSRLLESMPGRNFAIWPKLPPAIARAWTSMDSIKSANARPPPMAAAVERVVMAIKKVRAA